MIDPTLDPQTIAYQQFSKLSSADFAALERVAELTAQRLMVSKGLLKSPLLTPPEEANCQAIMDLFQFPDMMVRAATVVKVCACIDAGLTGPEALGHVERFFDDMTALGRAEFEV